MTYDGDPTDPATLFDGLPTSVISDCMGRLSGTAAMFAQHGDAPMAGRALTVRVRAGDNLFIHDALRRVTPGSIIVVDGGGCTERALIGEIIMAVARRRGAVGFVIDGSIRDVAAFRQAGFPCFARAVTHRGPYKNGPGEIGGTVVIDGQPVFPGDFVLGDEDGVVFVRPDNAAAVAAAARRKLADEASTLTSIEDGTYDESWIEAALAASMPLRP